MKSQSSFVYALFSAHDLWLDGLSSKKSQLDYTIQHLPLNKFSSHPESAAVLQKAQCRAERQDTVRLQSLNRAWACSDA